MDHKVTTIDIFGNDREIVEKQKKIISALPHVAVRGQVVRDLPSFFKKIDAAEILIINLGENGLNDLKWLENTNTAGESIVVVGDKSNINLLAVAINAGVSQFIDKSEYESELHKSVNKLILVRSEHGADNKKRTLNVIINAKGGSGASFIASNVAYALADFYDQKVSLLDLDLQFGSIGLNFDVTPKYTVTNVLKSIAEIDHVSLEAYLIKYNDRLRLLLPSPDELIFPCEIEPQALKSVLYLLQYSYNQIVIDLPRIIYPLSMMVLEQADHVIIVVQQTLAQYRDGQRMIQILNKDLDIPLEKIVVVINRYDPKASLKKSDMMKLLGHEYVFTIENDFERVAAACNLGEPLCKSAPNSKIAKDLINLAMFLGEVNESPKNKGLIGRIRSIFS